MITKTHYVYLLRDMIENTDDSCRRCPKRGTHEIMGKHSLEAKVIKGLRTNKEEMLFCDWCTDFITPNTFKIDNCPCHYFEPEEAIRKARNALKRWDKGKHKWQG